jgi:hypothetical protein
MNLYEVSLTKLSKQIVVKDGSIQKLLSDLSCTNVETIRRTIFQVGSCEVAEDQNFMRISENEISSARSQFSKQAKQQLSRGKIVYTLKNLEINLSIKK